MRRLLSSRVGVIATAIALAIEGVDCATICYPSCDTYATTALNQITPWNDNIVLPKFDSGDSRILNKVTIRTKVSIQTQIFVKCTASTSFCDNDLTGEVSAGVDIGVRPSSTQSNSLHTELPRYWGRWGGYRPGTLNDASQYDPASRVGTDAATNPFFIEYTYPFFDIPQYTPPAPAEAGTPYGVWSYLGQIGTQQSRILYTKDGKFGSAELGNVVIYNNPDPMFGDPETYSTEQYNVPANTLSTVKYGQGGTATPFNTDVPVGTLTYNSVVYEKTISDTDYAGAAGGGVNNDITPEDMFLLFSDPAGVADIEWDADATGFISTVLTGGNYVIRQETKGHVEMQIQYDYTGNAITQQDPQFSGFQGQSFQVHGYPGSYFHLMSAPQFQMNGRFAYLANGHCNYKHTPCWTHPGTYVDDIAIVVDELLVRITAGPVGQGYNVRINDEPFHAHAHNTTDDMMMNHTDTDSRAAFVPTKFYDAATRLTVHLRSPLEVVVRTDLFAFTIHNADHFFNIDSQLLVRPILIMGREASPKYPHPNTGKPWFPQFPIHGFVGQTWANAQYPHNKQYQGDVDDYLETRPYATESTYSQYYKKFDDKNMNWDN